MRGARDAAGGVFDRSLSDLHSCFVLLIWGTTLPGLAAIAVSLSANLFAIQVRLPDTHDCCLLPSFL